MQTNYSQIGRHFTWAKDTSLAISKQPKELQSLVNDKGSLTAALLDLGAGDFRVNVLQQRISLPYFHEQKKLGQHLSKAAMIREVELCVKEIPVVYARSIIPLPLVSRGRSGLANLGRTPLGHLLFKDGNIRVSKREFAFIDHQSKQLVARRTPYEYRGSTILVAEFFLPAIDTFL